MRSPQEQTDFLFTHVYRVAFENGISDAADDSIKPLFNQERKSFLQECPGQYETKLRQQLRQQTVSGASLDPFTALK